MELLIPLGTALLLGVRHAFEADHLAAVGAFAAGRPGPRQAVAFGLRWAAGHGAVVVGAGSVLLLIGLQMPDTAGVWLERLVGVSLVALGGWTVLSGSTLHAHRHRHADGTVHVHVHSHVGGEGHEHGHAATAIGALHGLAGTAPAVALVPVVQLDSAWLGAGYLLLFAAGTAAAMALYALLAGVVAGGAAVRSARLARAVAVVSGLATAAVGLYWLLGA